MAERCDDRSAEDMFLVNHRTLGYRIGSLGFGSTSFAERGLRAPVLGPLHSAPLEVALASNRVLSGLFFSWTAVVSRRWGSQRASEETNESCPHCHAVRIFIRLNCLFWLLVQEEGRTEGEMRHGVVRFELECPVSDYATAARRSPEAAETSISNCPPVILYNGCSYSVE